MSVCFQIGVSITNQDFVCLLWGEAKVRVASTMTQSSVCAISLPNATKPRLRLFAFKSGSPEQTKILPVCYGGKRRYELLSMIEQSDIIRATSLPNAALALPNHFTALYPASMAAILALTTFSPLRSKIRLTPAMTLSYSMPNIGIDAPNNTMLAA